MAEVKEKVMASELRDRNDAELQSMLSEKVDELHGVKFKRRLDSWLSLTSSSNSSKILHA
jgi:ribosomal protein L29